MEEKADRMHQQAAQPAIAQMPQITRPDALHPTPISQLPKDGVDQVPHSPQHRTVVGCRLGGMRFAERRVQYDAFRAQEGLQVGQPIVAIPQDPPGRSSQQERHNFSIGFIRWGQEDAGEQTWPTQLRMQPKAIKGLAIRVIFAVAGLTTKAHTPGRASKTADGQGYTVYDGHPAIIADQFIAQPTPQPLFDRPQVRGLPHKRGTSDLSHGGKEMAIVATKVVKDFLVLGESQIGADYFHRDDLTISQLGHRPSLAQARSFRHRWYHLVNQTETCDNKIVQVHGVPPQKLANLLRKVDSMDPFFGKNTCTSC